MQMTLFTWRKASLFLGLCLLSWPVLSQTILMQDGNVTACGGFFTDSGGNAAGYNPNEDFTLTICPDGTSGTHVQLIFSGVELGAGDQLTFFDSDTADPATQFTIDIMPGMPFIIQATAANLTGCLTIQFTSDGTNQSNGWSADINCIPACQLIQSILVSTDPEVMPVDTGYIDACPGDRIFFTGEGMYPQNGIVYDHSDFTSDFFWDFGDGNTAVGPDVSHRYEEPGGYVVQLTITDQFGCTNTNFISQRVRISPPPIFTIGGDLLPEVCAGDTVLLNAAVDTVDVSNNVSVTPTSGSFQSGGVRSDSLPLPDGTGAVYETSINFTDFAPGQVLEDVNDLESICVVMEHSWLFDLDVFISCPDGTQVILQNQEFIGNEVFLGEPFEADDFNTPDPPGQGIGYEYCWTPGSTNGTWTEYVQDFDPQTLPSQDYNSFESLDALVGCPLNGEWTIIVQDQWGSDNGWIFEWSINLNPELYPSIESFTPGIVDFAWQDNPSIFYYSVDSIAAAPQNAGTANYTFEVTNDYGCTYDTTVNFSVLPFSHPDCYSCLDSLAEIPDAVICDNGNIQLDASSAIATENEITFEAYPQYEIGFSNHPPNNPYASSMDVNSIFPATLDDPFSQIASVCVNLETDWNSDITLRLRAPSGELLELSSGNGGGSNNYTNTCFTPNAATPITSGTGPFTGEFQPEGTWAILQGADIEGEWQLLVSDAFGINDMGELISWSISFNSVVETQYSWSPSTTLTCDDCPDPVAFPDFGTTYTVNYEDSYGCIYQEEVFVGVVQDIPAPNVFCEVGEPGSGELIFTWSQVDQFNTYEVNIISSTGESGWIGPINGTTFTVPGLMNNEEITLQVRVFASGSGADCTLEIGSSTCTYTTCEIEATVDALTGIDCFGDTNGTINISATAGEPPYSFFLDGDNTPFPDGNFDNLGAGAHTVAIEDATGCQIFVDFTTPGPSELTLDIALDQAISCFDATDGSLAALPAGGTTPYIFDWNNNQADSLNTNLGGGDYELTVTDANGCNTTATITLDVPAALVLTLETMDASCFDSQDGQITAQVEGGTGDYSYEWDNNAGNVDAAQNLLAGSYCVTVTDENGCQVSACEDVAAPEQLVIDEILATDVLCNGGNTGTTSVTASGGTGDYTYSWDDDLAQVSPMATSLIAGTYSVTVTDENSCTASAEIEVVEPDLLEASAQAVDVLCRGEESGVIDTEVNGGTEPYTYTWNTQDQEADLTDLAAGTYFLTVSDANNCTEQLTIQIEEPEEGIELEIEQTKEACFGELDNEATVFPQGGTAPYTYQWSNGQTAQTAVGLDTLSQFVIVEDANGCSAEISIELQDLDSIFVNVIPKAPSCFGYTDGELAVNIAIGGIGEDVEDYDFSWSDGQSGPQVGNLAGAMMYTVTATDAQGCTGTAFQVLSQPPPVTFDIDSTAVSCFGFSDGMATVSNLVGSGMAFDISWDANAGNQEGLSATDLASGNYQVTVTDEDGCMQEGSIFIPQPTEVVVSLSTVDNGCFGDFEGSIRSEVNGGTPGYNYVWSNGSNDTRVSSLQAGEYELTVTDANGCENISTAEILQPDILLADIEVQDVDCFGGRNGRFIVNPAGGTPPYRYSLDNENYNGASTIVGLEQGEYTVFVQDNNGCIFFEEALVNEPEEFMVEAGLDLEIVLGDSVQLLAQAINAQGPVEFVWTAPYAGTLSCNECVDPVVRTQNTIMYELYGIDSNGCEDTDFIRVIIDKPRTVLVPTGFSPNGDNTNDRLYVHGREGTIIRTFRVFDRWGQLLFENSDFDVNDQNEGWDGSYRGEVMSSGVYIWYLEAEYIDGAEEVYKGQTTLIR